MAIGTPVDRGRAGGTTSATTASFTPTANTVLFANVSSKSASAPTQPTISDSLGGTWTLIQTGIDGPASNPFIKSAVYWQQIAGSPAAMTVTATGGTTSTVVAVVEISGNLDTTFFTNTGKGTDTAGDPTATLASAPGTNSATIGFAIGHLNNAFSVTAGFSILYQGIPAGASNHRVAFVYDLPTSPGQTTAYTSSETNSVAWLLEIAETTGSSATGLASGTGSASGIANEVPMSMDFVTGTYSGAQVSDLTVTRSGPLAYAKTSSGTLTSFATNLARITDLGLLIEPSRTNLCLRSEEFDDAAWTKSNVTITADSTAAPNGTTTGDTLTDNSTNAAHTVASTAMSFSSGGVYILSVYIKAGTASVAQICFDTAAFSGDPYANFDLTGAGTVSVGGTNTPVGQIEQMGSGWYRCSLSAQATASVSAPVYINRIASTAATRAAAYAGSSTTVIAWGYQCENVSGLSYYGPSSYIPTTTASATRGGDTITMTGTSFSNWFVNATAGTGYVECVHPPSNGTTQYTLAFNNGASNNDEVANLFNSNIAVLLSVVTTSVSQASITSTTALATAGTIFRQAFAWAANDFTLYAMGSVVGTPDTGGTVPPLNQLAIGKRGGSATSFGGLIRAIGFWPSRKSNSELVTITTVPAGSAASAAGVGAASGDGGAIASASGSAAGTSTLTAAVGASTAASPGNAAGTGGGIAQGTVISAAQGTAAGVGAAAAGNGTLTSFNFAGGVYTGCALADLTVARSQTVPTYALNSAGTLTTFAANTPRVTDLGLLIEEGRQNLCIQSQTFDNASWTKTNVTVTANTDVAPDGTTTADSISDNTGSAQHFAVSTNIAFTSGTVYACSVYLRAGSAWLAQITLGAAAFSHNPYVNVNLATGTITAQGGTIVAATIERLAGSWYRVIMVTAADTTASAGFAISRLNTATDVKLPIYSGFGQTIAAWGAQVEAVPTSSNVYATTYTLTTSTAISRNRDIVTITGATFTADFPGVQTTGTAFIEFVTPPSNNSNQFLLDFSIGSGINDNQHNFVGGTLASNYAVTTASVGQATIVGALVTTPGSIRRHAFAWAVNDFDFHANGTVQGTPDTAGTVPAVTQLNIGKRANDTFFLNTFVRSISYWPYRRTSTDLNDITSGAQGIASGQGLAAAVGLAFSVGVGTAAGVGAANGQATAISSGDGNATGLGGALGISSFGSFGQAAGTGGAQAQGASIVAAQGNAGGLGGANGTGLAARPGDGSAAGLGGASTNGGATSLFSGVGNATGLGGANGIATPTSITISGVGSASGIGNAFGISPSRVTGGGGGKPSGGRPSKGPSPYSKALEHERRKKRKKEEEEKLPEPVLEELAELVEAIPDEALDLAALLFDSRQESTTPFVDTVDIIESTPEGYADADLQAMADYAHQHHEKQRQRREREDRDIVAILALLL